MRWIRKTLFPIQELRRTTANPTTDTAAPRRQCGSRNSLRAASSQPRRHQRPASSFHVRPAPHRSQGQTAVSGDRRDSEHKPLPVSSVSQEPEIADQSGGTPPPSLPIAVWSTLAPLAWTAGRRRAGRGGGCCGSQIVSVARLPFFPRSVDRCSGQPKCWLPGLTCPRALDLAWPQEPAPRRERLARRRTDDRKEPRHLEPTWVTLLVGAPGDSRWTFLWARPLFLWARPLVLSAMPKM